MPEVTQRQDIHTGKTLLSLYQEYGGNSSAYVCAVNTILAEQRLKAAPYEARVNQNLPDSEKSDPFMVSALIRTRDNRFFTAANMHLHNSPARNQCAEASALLEAANTVGPEHAKVAEVWLMGGPADAITSDIIKKGEQGRITTPCGSCRDGIHNHSAAAEEVLIHAIPLNDGTLSPLPDDGRAKDTMPAHMIQTFKISELLPQPRLDITLSAADAQKALAWLSETTTKHNKAPRPGHVGTLAGRENQYLQSKTERKRSGKAHVTYQDLTKDIYSSLVYSLRKRMQDKSKLPLRKASLAIARTEQGRYYFGRWYDDSQSPSMPEGEMHAIQNMEEGAHLSDIFVLNVDVAAIETHSKRGGDTLSVQMPDGNTLERIKKARTRNETDVSPFRQTGTQPRVHMFSLVSPKAFDANTHMHSFSLHELLPHSFQNPKQEVKQPCSHIHTTDIQHKSPTAALRQDR